MNIGYLNPRGIRSTLQRRVDLKPKGERLVYLGIMVSDDTHYSVTVGESYIKINELSSWGDIVDIGRLLQISGWMPLNEDDIEQILDHVIQYQCVPIIDNRLSTVGRDL